MNNGLLWTNYMGFVLGRVCLLWSLPNMNRFISPQGVHNIFKLESVNNGNVSKPFLER